MYFDLKAFAKTTLCCQSALFINYFLTGLGSNPEQFLPVSKIACPDTDRLYY